MSINCKLNILRFVTYSFVMSRDAKKNISENHKKDFFLAKNNLFNPTSNFPIFVLMILSIPPLLLG